MVQPGRLVSISLKHPDSKRKVGAHHSGKLGQIASVITSRRVYNLESTNYSDLKAFFSMIDAVVLHWNCYPVIKVAYVLERECLLLKGVRKDSGVAVGVKEWKVIRTPRTISSLYSVKACFLVIIMDCVQRSPPLFACIPPPGLS